MQQCPDCGRIYDESEDAKCPYCYFDDGLETYYIVTDNRDRKVKEVPESEYRDHPEYYR